MSVTVSVPRGRCPWCGQRTGADKLPGEPIPEGGFRVQALHYDRVADAMGFVSSVGCNNRVRLYLAPDGTAPHGWERNRSPA